MQDQGDGRDNTLCVNFLRCLPPSLPVDATPFTVNGSFYTGGSWFQNMLDIGEQMHRSDGAPSNLWLDETSLRALRRKGLPALARFLRAKGSTQTSLVATEAPLSSPLISELTVVVATENETAVGKHARHGRR